MPLTFNAMLVVRRGVGTIISIYAFSYHPFMDEEHNWSMSYCCCWDLELSDLNPFIHMVSQWFYVEYMLLFDMCMLLFVSLSSLLGSLIIWATRFMAPRSRTVNNTIGTISYYSMLIRSVNWWIWQKLLLQYQKYPAFYKGLRNLVLFSWCITSWGIACKSWEPW